MQLNERKIIHNVRIVDICYLGNHYFIHNGKKYYISRALKDEIVDARILNKRLGYRIAEIESIIEKSPYRIIPVCSYYNICTACDFLHVIYNEQLKLKINILKQSLNKYNIDFSDIEIIPSLSQINYRNNATFKVFNINDKLTTGFVTSDKRFKEIDNCYLLNNRVNELNLIIRHWLNEKAEFAKYISGFTIRINSNDESIVIFLTDKKDKIDCNIFKDLEKYFIGIYIKAENNFYCITEKKYFSEKINGIKFRIHPLSFFQNNYSIASEIVNFLNTKLCFENKIIYDLYCGNGFISLSLKTNNRSKILGIDNNQYAINDAKQNAKLLQDKGESVYICGDVLKTFNEDFLLENPKPDIIILDPPRFGALIEVMKNIVRSKAEYVIYISCNPVSLAWNLSLIIENYKIQSLVVFDMFPQTKHLESVAILKRII